jgi:hypothetical protein
MKKIIAIVALSLLASTQAFAAAAVTMVLTTGTPVTGATLYGDTSTTATTSSTLIGKTSTGVGFGGLTGVGGYAITTQHKSGNRQIGGSFDSTSLVYIDVTTVGIPVLGVPGASDHTAFDTATWKSL